MYVVECIYRYNRKIKMYLILTLSLRFETKSNDRQLHGYEQSPGISSRDTR
jgi:hypothetical protein